MRLLTAGFGLAGSADGESDGAHPVLTVGDRRRTQVVRASVTGHDEAAQSMLLDDGVGHRDRAATRQLRLRLVPAPHTRRHRIPLAGLMFCLRFFIFNDLCLTNYVGWLGSRVVSVLDSCAEGPGFKSQPRRCQVLGKSLTPIVPLFSESESSPLKGCGSNCKPGGK